MNKEGRKLLSHRIFKNFCWVIALLICVIAVSSCRAGGEGGPENAGWSQVAFKKSGSESVQTRDWKKGSIRVGTAFRTESDQDANSRVKAASNFVRNIETMAPFHYTDFSYPNGFREREFNGGPQARVVIVRVPGGKEFLTLVDKQSGDVAGVFPFSPDGTLNLSPQINDVLGWRRHYARAEKK